MIQKKKFNFNKQSFCHYSFLYSNHIVKWFKNKLFQMSAVVRVMTVLRRSLGKHFLSMEFPLGSIELSVTLTGSIFSICSFSVLHILGLKFNSLNEYFIPVIYVDNRRRLVRLNANIAITLSELEKNEFKSKWYVNDEWTRPVCFEHFRVDRIFERST